MDYYNPPMHTAEIVRFPTEQVMPAHRRQMLVKRILNQKLRLEEQQNQTPLQQALRAVEAYHAG